MHPDLKQLIQVCSNHKISHVVLAGGLPQAHSIQDLKSFDCQVIGFAPALIIAKS